jgi:hypothetical protein
MRKLDSNFDSGVQIPRIEGAHLLFPSNSYVTFIQRIQQTCTAELAVESRLFIK